MIDAQTIDSLTLLKFKNYEAKERWLHLIKYDYFEDVDTEIAMDFARRWGKLMQYLSKENLSNFDGNGLRSVRRYYVRDPVPVRASRF